MLRSERQNEIMGIVKGRGFIKVSELCRSLYVSESSIRRDLAELEKMGLIKRSYGGAEDISAGTHIIPFATRSYSHAEEKYAIAKKAVSLIKENDVIFIDSSSTGYFLALAIRDMKNLTVVTNNTEIVSLLAPSSLSVYCTGGKVHPNDTNCLIGGAAREGFARVFADIAFFSTKSVDENGILSDCSPEETDIRSIMLKNAKRKVFLCDSTKIGTRSSFIQGSLSEIDVAVSEKDAFSSFSEKFPTLLVL